MTFEFFAWVGEGDDHDFGIKMIEHPLHGFPSSAVFATRRVAENPVVVAQMQANAQHFGKPMRLVRVVATDDDVLRTLTPNPQG